MIHKICEIYSLLDNTVDCEENKAQKGKAAFDVSMPAFLCVGFTKSCLEDSVGLAQTKEAKVPGSKIYKRVPLAWLLWLYFKVAPLMLTFKKHLSGWNGQRKLIISSNPTPASNTHIRF